MADGSVQGFTQDRYAAVRAAFEENLSSGADVGASFCATVEGETATPAPSAWPRPCGPRRG